MKRVVSVVLVGMLVGLGVGCTDKEAQTALAEMRAQVELEARNIEVIKTLFAELDKGNVGAYQKYYAPDAKYFFPSNSPTPMSRDDEAAMSKMMMAAFPDLTYQVTDIFAVRDRVVATFVGRGTHKAELEGIPATGNTIGFGSISIFRLRNGLVVEEMQEGDMVGLYQQLGMELRPRAPTKSAK
jgi:steroid delta-isomerase-like uncharacterized protein